MALSPFPRIAAVVLNYNSAEDTLACVERLAAQRDVLLFTIVVDNASSEQQRNCLKQELLRKHPSLLEGSIEELRKHLSQLSQTPPAQLFVLWAKENRGYSAGNNLGISLADALDVQSVLIINPDALIEHADFLVQMHSALMASEQNLAAGPRILSLSGLEENPLREAGFWEELLWPVTMLRRKFLKSPTIWPSEGHVDPLVVPKISGTCLLLRMDYLRNSGYLDEAVFLYCEEPILAARIHRSGGRLVFVPQAKVIHAHRKSAKGRLKPRLLAFVRSRSYYLRNYTKYSRLAQNALIASHHIFAWTVGLKDYLPRKDHRQS